MFVFKNSRGMLNMRVFLIPMTTAVGLLLGLGINLASRQNVSQPPNKSASALEQHKALFSSLEKDYVFQPSVSADANGASVDSYMIPPLGAEQPVSYFDMPAKDHRQLSDAKSSLTRLKDYIRNLEQKNILLNEKTEFLTSLLEAKKAELIKLNEYNVSLKENLDKGLQAQDKLNQDLESVASQLKQKDSEVSILNTIKTGLENQVKELEAVRTKAEGELRSKVDQSVVDKNNIEMQLVKAREELRQQVSFNETLNKNIEELSKALNSKEEERKRLADNLQQWQESQGQLDLEFSKLRSEKANLENQISELRLRMSELDASYQDARRQVLQFTSLISKKELERELAISDKESAVSAVNAQLYQMTNERDALAASVSEKDKVIRDLQGRIKDLEARLSSLQKDLNLEKERQGHVSQQVKRLQELNDSMKKRLKNIYFELEILRAQKLEKKKRHDSLYQ